MPLMMAGGSIAEVGSTAQLVTVNQYIVTANNGGSSETSAESSADNSSNNKYYTLPEYSAADFRFTILSFDGFVVQKYQTSTMEANDLFDLGSLKVDPVRVYVDPDAAGIVAPNYNNGNVTAGNDANDEIVDSADELNIISATSTAVDILTKMGVGTQAIDSLFFKIFSIESLLLSIFFVEKNVNSFNESGINNNEEWILYYETNGDIPGMSRERALLSYFETALVLNIYTLPIGAYLLINDMLYGNELEYELRCLYEEYDDFILNSMIEDVYGIDTPSLNDFELLDDLQEKK